MNYRVWITAFEESSATEYAVASPSEALDQFFKSYAAFPWKTMGLSVRSLETNQVRHFKVRGVVMIEPLDENLPAHQASTRRTDRQVLLSIEAQVCRLSAALTSTQKEIETMSQAFDQDFSQLQAQVAQTIAGEQSALVVINGIADRIVAAVNAASDDSAKVAAVLALTNQLQTSAAALAAGVATQPTTGSTTAPATGQATAPATPPATDPNAGNAPPATSSGS